MVDSVATSALAIALVALITALGQLLQQYFATADGYRRCQKSVMGLWASKTRMRFRWSEFRLETNFVIPRIVYKYQLQPPTAALVNGNCVLTNTADSLNESMTTKGWYNEAGRNFYQSDELACWVPLLATLHSQGAEATMAFREQPLGGCKLIGLPSIQFIHKSWDFMPPDIIRPMASSTVSAVAIMAIKLGMVWKAFEPAGSLRAEGNGHMFTSTLARSFGIILQYSFTNRMSATNLHYTPAIEADKMVFGRVTLDSRLLKIAGDVFDLEIGSYKGLARSLPKLFQYPVYGTRKQVETALSCIKMAMDREDTSIPGLCDLLPLCSSLAAPWMDRIPSPIMYNRGVTASYEALLVLTFQTQKLVNSRREEQSEQLNTMLSLLANLNQPHYAEVWNREHDSQRQALPVEHMLRLLLIEHHTEMTNFLHKSTVNYTRLVCQHVYAAIQDIDRDLTENDSEYKTYIGNFSNPMEEMDSIDINKSHFTTMHRYFTHILPSVVSRVTLLSKKEWPHPVPSPTDIEDAWIAMMLRAFCWQRCHHMIEGVEPLPSEYWNSKMPVYIG